MNASDIKPGMLLRAVTYYGLPVYIFIFEVSKTKDDQRVKVSGMRCAGGRSWLVTKDYVSPGLWENVKREP